MDFVPYFSVDGQKETNNDTQAKYFYTFVVKLAIRYNSSGPIY